MSALHWNKDLFEARFTEIFGLALNAYQRISSETGVQMHPQRELAKYLEEINADFKRFMDISLAGSARSQRSESRTRHRREFIADGDKAEFELKNYLGGVYHLTADAAFRSGDAWVIQESKNSSEGALPSLADIRDGLFKLILFSHLDKLALDGRRVQFRTQLRLTGKKIRGTIQLPCAIPAGNRKRLRKSFPICRKILPSTANHLSAAARCSYTCGRPVPT